jgi:hypothetical protein
MARRSLVSMGELAGLMAGSSGSRPFRSGARAHHVRKRAARRRRRTPARTPDGQPDLSGYWTNTSSTPLERPKNVTKEFYTPDRTEGGSRRGATGRRSAGQLGARRAL